MWMRALSLGWGGGALEGNYMYLAEQVEAIKELGDHITNLKRVGSGHGEYHFDRSTLK